MVAQYAQACNLFDSPDLAHKLDVLRGHCEALGRDYDEIEKTVMGRIDPGPNGEQTDETLEHLRGLAALGVTHVQTFVGDGSRTDWLELMGDRLIPEAKKL